MDKRQLNDQLYSRLQSGDASARAELIEANMPLVTYLVKRFVKHCPKATPYREDLISEGYLALASAVDSMRECTNVAAYLGFWINKSLGQFLDKELGAGIRHLPKTNRIEVTEGEDVEAQVGPESCESIDMLDSILACCELDEERVIVQMRAKNYVDKDIATQLDLPLTTVYVMRRELYRRFLERTGMRGEV